MYMGALPLADGQLDRTTALCRTCHAQLENRVNSRVASSASRHASWVMVPAADEWVCSKCLSVWTPAASLVPATAMLDKLSLAQLRDYVAERERRAATAIEAGRLARYHFDFGNSNTEAIGMCAVIVAPSELAAVAKLQAALKALYPENEIMLEQADDAAPAAGVDYICVYLNPANITTKDIDDVEAVEARETEEELSKRGSCLAK